MPTAAPCPDPGPCGRAMPVTPGLLGWRAPGAGLGASARCPLGVLPPEPVLCPGADPPGPGI